MTTYAEHQANEDFDPRAFGQVQPRRGSARLAALREQFVRDWLVNPIASSAIVPERIRLAVLRSYGLRIGASRITPGCWFGGSKVTIGDNVFINRGCQFDNSEPITIGDDAGLGMGCMLITSSHEVGPPEHRVGPILNAPIIVGAGAWIANRVTILPGTVIGAGCVVAAGSLVRGELEPNCFYAGVPARKIREL